MDCELVSILHPGLGAVFKGVKTAESSDQESSSVAQFRGIKFARIPARLRNKVSWRIPAPFSTKISHRLLTQPVMGTSKSHRPDDLCDWYANKCMKSRYAVKASNHWPEEIEDLLNGASPESLAVSGRPESVVMDEFECLNLVITAPVLKSTESVAEQLFPVMIYIHG